MKVEVSIIIQKLHLPLHSCIQQCLNEKKQALFNDTTNQIYGLELGLSALPSSSHLSSHLIATQPTSTYIQVANAAPQCKRPYQ